MSLAKPPAITVVESSEGNAGSTPARSGGGVDVPLRAVAGSDGGEVPAPAEVPAGRPVQAMALEVLERLVEATSGWAAAGGKAHEAAQG